MAQTDADLATREADGASVFCVAGGALVASLRAARVAAHAATGVAFEMHASQIARLARAAEAALDSAIALCVTPPAAGHSRHRHRRRGGRARGRESGARLNASSSSGSVRKAFALAPGGEAPMWLQKSVTELCAESTAIIEVSTALPGDPLAGRDLELAGPQSRDRSPSVSEASLCGASDGEHWPVLRRSRSVPARGLVEFLYGPGCGSRPGDALPLHHRGPHDRDEDHQLSERRDRREPRGQGPQLERQPLSELSLALDRARRVHARDEGSPAAAIDGDGDPPLGPQPALGFAHDPDDAVAPGPAGAFRDGAVGLSARVCPSLQLAGDGHGDRVAAPTQARWVDMASSGSDAGEPPLAGVRASLHDVAPDNAKPAPLVACAGQEHRDVNHATMACGAPRGFGGSTHCAATEERAAIKLLELNTRLFEGAVHSMTQIKKWWQDPVIRPGVERARRVLKLIQDFNWYYKKHLFAAHLVSEFATEVGYCCDNRDGLANLDDDDVRLVCQAWDAIWYDKDSWTPR